MRSFVVVVVVVGIRLLPGPSAATRTAPPLLAALLGRAADIFIVAADLREVETGACLEREAREDGIFSESIKASERARKKRKKVFFFFTMR